MTFPHPQQTLAHLEELAAEDRWILDGNFGGTLKQRFARADLLIYLDYPRRTYLRRVLLRWWRYRGRNRPDLPAGCDEKIDPAFLKWLWTYPSLRRPETLALLRGARAAGKQVVRLRSDREVRRFLAAFGPEHGA